VAKPIPEDGVVVDDQEADAGGLNHADQNQGR
jgi:hypothetical protein